MNAVIALLDKDNVTPQDHQQIKYLLKEFPSVVLVDTKSAFEAYQTLSADTTFHMDKLTQLNNFISRRNYISCTPGMHSVDAALAIIQELENYKRTSLDG